MFWTTLLLPDLLQAWPQHVVGAALVSCPPWSTWAQKWLAELLSLTKGTAEQLMSSTAVPEAAGLIVRDYRGGPAPLSSWPCNSAAFLDLGVLGACQMATELIHLTNPKENHLHVTLSLLAGREHEEIWRQTAFILQLDVAIPVDIACSTVLQESLEQNSLNLVCKSLSKYGYWKLWNYPLFTACKAIL